MKDIILVRFLFITILTSFCASANDVKPKIELPKTQILENDEIDEGFRMNVDSSDMFFDSAKLKTRLKRIDLGDFAALNDLLVGWTANFKSFSMYDLPAPLASTAAVDIISCDCSNFRIGEDGSLGYAGFRDDNEAINDLRFADVEFKCEIQWEFRNWQVVLERGSSTIKADTGALINIIVESEDFNEFLPTSIQLSEDGCTIFLNINSISVEGSIRAALADIFQRQVKDFFIGRVTPEVCSALQTRKIQTLRSTLNAVSDAAAPYMTEITKEQVDPLEPQRNLPIPTNARLLNFTSSNPEELGVRVFNAFVDSFTTEYGIFIPDSDGEPLLAINKVIRDSFLDKDRKLLLPFDLIFEGDGMVLDSSDWNFRIQVYVTEMKLVGLDTIAEFSIFNPIGRQTLRNNITWSNLGLELGLKADLSSGVQSLPVDIIIELPPQTLEFTATPRFQDFEVILTFLSAIDLNILTRIKLRDILIAECALAFLPDFTIAQSDILFKGSRNVLVSNFISTGIDLIAQEVAESILEMFEVAFVTLIPNFVATTFRERIQNEIESTLKSFSNRQCPSILGGSVEFVDFRELFYNTTEVSDLGITAGSLPYGDSLARSKTWFQKTFLTPNLRGESYLNDLIVNPLTTIFFGTPGTLKFVLPIGTPMANSSIFSININDVSIQNIDSFGFPLRLLDPTKDDPYTLVNEFTVGIKKPFQVVTNVVLSNGKDAFRNVLNVTLSLPNTKISGNVFAKVQEEQFLNYPLRDSLNLFCLLATISPSSSSGTLSKSLSLSKINISNQDALLLIQCVSCSSPGMTELPQLLSTLQVSTKLVAKRIVQSSEEVLNGDDTQGLLDLFLSIAGRSCTHNPLYDPEFEPITFLGTSIGEGIPLPTLSESSADLIALSIILSSFMAAVIFPLSLDLESYSESDPFMRPSNLNAKGLIVFNNSSSASDLSRSISSFMLAVDESLGLCSTETSKFDVESTTFVSFNDTDNVTVSTATTIIQPEVKLGINSLFGGFDPLQIDFFRSWMIPSPPFSNANEQATLTFEVIQVFGLDSFTEFDLFNTIGPQTIQSQFGLKSLGLDFIGSIDLSSSSSQRVRTAIDFIGVKLDSSILLAVDETALEDIILGPLLDTNLIRACVIPAIAALNLNQFRLSAETIGNIKFSGLLDETLEALTASTTSFITKYGPLIISILPSLTDGYLRTEVNKRIANFLQSDDINSLENPLSCPMYRGADVFIDFRVMFESNIDEMNQTSSANDTNVTSVGYGDIPPMIRTFIDNYLEAPDTRSTFRMQENIPKLNSYLPESYAVATNLLDFQINLNQTTNAANDIVAIKVFDVVLNNFDSVRYPLDILKPRSDNPYILDNILTMGTEQRPLIISFTFEVSLEGSTRTVMDRLNVTVELNKVQVALSILAKINAESLLNIPVLDLFDLNCLLATISPANFFDGTKTASIDFDLNYSDAKVSAICIECTSPQFELLQSNLNTTSTAETLSLLGKSFLEYTIEPLNEALQLQIDAALFRAKSLCAKVDPIVADINERIEFPSKIRLFSFIVLGPLIFLAFVLWYFLRYTREKAKNRYQRWLLSIPEKKVLEMYRKQLQKETREKELDENLSSMIRSEEIFFFTRYFFPFLVLSSCSLFVSGHFNFAAIARFEGFFGGEEIIIPQLFKLRLSDTLGWNGWAGLISFFQVMITIVWPYIKLLGTFLIWLLPPSQLNIEKRSAVLSWLDLLTKWAAINMISLLLYIFFFRDFRFNNAAGFVLPENFLDLQIVFVPVWGFYAGLLAQIISHVISYISLSVQERFKPMIDFVIDEDKSSVYVVDLGSTDHESTINSKSSRTSKEVPISTENLPKQRSTLGAFEQAKSPTDATSLVRGLDDANESFKKEQELVSFDNQNVHTTTLISSVTSPDFDVFGSSVKKDVSNIGSKNQSISSSTVSKEMRIAREGIDNAPTIENLNISSGNEIKASLALSESIRSHADDMALSFQQKENVEISEDEKALPENRVSTSTLMDADAQASQKTIDTSQGTVEHVKSMTSHDNQISRSRQKIYTHSHKATEASFEFEERDETGEQLSMKTHGYGRIRALNKYTFKDNYYDDGTRVEVAKYTNTLLSILILLTFILLFVGFGGAVFNVQFFGVASFLFPTDSLSVSYSAFQLINAFGESAETLESGALSFGLYLLSSIFVITIFIVPLMTVILLTLMWFSPMRMRLRFVLLKGIRILESNQYLQVFILAVFLLMWQAENIVDTYLEAYCDGLQERFFPLAAITGFLNENNARCIYIALEPRLGLFALIYAYILLEFLSQFVKRATEHNVEDYKESVAVNIGLEVGSSDDSLVEDENYLFDEALERLKPNKPKFTDIFEALLVPCSNNLPGKSGTDFESALSMDDFSASQVPSSVSIGLSMNNEDRMLEQSISATSSKLSGSKVSSESVKYPKEKKRFWSSFLSTKGSNTKFEDSASSSSSILSKSKSGKSTRSSLL